MKLAWLRQDPAIRVLPYWLLIGPIAMSATLGVVAYYAGSAAREAELAPGSWSLSSFTTWASLFWCAVAFFFFTPGCRQRCNRLSMTLPLSPRKLWLTHLLAVVLSGLAICVVAWGFVVLQSMLLTQVLKGPNILQPDIVRLSIHLMAGLILAAVVLHTPKLSLREIPLSKGYVIYLVSTLTGVLGLIIMLGPLPLYAALIPLGAAVALGLRNVRSLPAALAFVPLIAEEESTLKERPGGFTEPTRPTQGIAYSLFLQRVVWRNLYGKWFLWIWLALACFIFLGILLSGVTWTESQSLYYQRFTLIPITVYTLLALLAMPMRNIYRLDPLPISRKLLFATITLPFLVILSVGYGVGQIWSAWAEPQELIRYRMDPDSRYYVYVPIGATEIAWDGRVPENTSPWGETHAAWSEPLFRGSRAKFYSLYHTPIGSSFDFVALQISRATEAIYGESVPPGEIKERYLEVDAEGNVVLKGQALTLQTDYPHLEPRSKGAIFPAVLLLVGLPWMMIISIYLRSFRSEISERTRKIVFFGILFLLLAVHIGQYAFIFSQFTQDWKITGVLEILIRRWSEGLLGVSAIWGVSVALLYAGYRFAERRFLQIEVPDKPDKLPVWEAFAES